MFKLFSSLFSCKIAIDLGTTNTLIYMQGKGIILNEPSVVALVAHKSDALKKDLVVGRDANNMFGKTPDQIEVIRPIKDGVIVDFYITELMIKHFIVNALSFKRRLRLFRPIVVVSVPLSSTMVERHAIKDAVLAAGASRVEIVEEAMVAAIGAGLPVESSRASMIVNIGGGTTEIGVISLGCLVSANSIKFGGDRIDDAITNYIRIQHGLLIGISTAEMIKISIGSAHHSINNLSMSVRGRCAFSGLPKQIVLTSEDIYDSLRVQLYQIVTAIKQVLELTPPELSADLIDSGMVLTGGGALLRGLDLLFYDATQLKVTIADEPLLCVTKGFAAILDDL